MRHFEFAVDEDHARSVNENVAEIRRLRWSAAVIAVVFAALAVWLATLGTGWAWVLCVVLAVLAATAVWVALWAPRKVGTATDLYRTSALVPAVVAEVRPRGLTLLSLMDVARPGHSPRYALVARQVTALAGRPVTLGARVPSVAVLGDRTTRADGEVWQLARPMPIAWGTRDHSVLADAEAAVPESEWHALEAALGRLTEVDADPNRRILLSTDELPHDLR